MYDTFPRRARSLRSVVKAEQKQVDKDDDDDSSDGDRHRPAAR
ncbi:hypothetical protein [Micromonospora sp. NPDC049171]